MKVTFALVWAIACAVGPITLAYGAESRTADKATSEKTGPGACAPGSRACPSVARVLPGGYSSYVSGSVTKDSPRFFVAVEAQGSTIPGEPPGALFLTIDGISGAGINGGAGVPISFPAGKGGDAVQPGKSFKLPGPGTYVLEFAANSMSDNAFGPFLVKLNVGPEARAAERPVLCKLVVKGKTYIDQQCWFSPRGKGSFQIAAANGYLAQVDVDGKTAEAHWNEDPRGIRAHTRLGRVTRTGACWGNATTQICARELPADKLSAELAAQPKGDSIAAVVAGNLCLLPKGMKWAEGVPLVVDSCPYDRSVSRFMRVGDAIRIDQAADLCVGVARGARTLELQKCSTTGVRWSYEPADLGALARSNHGDCWTIPELDNEKAKWPLAVAVLPCGDKKAKPQAFYF